MIVVFVAPELNTVALLEDGVAFHEQPLPEWFNTDLVDNKPAAIATITIDPAVSPDLHRTTIEAIRTFIKRKLYS